MPQFHSGEPVAAGQGGDSGAGEERGAGPGPGRHREAGGRLVGDHGDYVQAGDAQGVGRGTADGFVADDDSAGTDPLPVEMDGLLEFSGGVDAGWARAGYEAGAAGAVRNTACDQPSSSWSPPRTVAPITSRSKSFWLMRSTHLRPM